MNRVTAKYGRCWHDNTIYRFANPNIQVWSVDLEGDRSLTLRHTMHNETPLSADTHEVLKHLHHLWGFDIHLETYQQERMVKRISCPATTLEDY